MTEAEQMAERIRARLASLKVGTLRFWGEWFGRPYDNGHRIADCEGLVNELRVHFDEGELLTISSPRGLLLGAQTFRITDARQVRWEWFAYGRPRIAENRYWMQFVRGPIGIKASTNADWYTELRPSRRQPAVEML